MAYDKLKESLANWIDTNVLAEVIVESMREYSQRNEMTLDNAKGVWLNFLESEFSDSIDRAIRYTPSL